MGGAPVLLDVGQVVVVGGLQTGLMPDGYLNSTPKQVLRFFHSHWKKLDLDRIELDEPAKPARKGKK